MTGFGTTSEEQNRLLSWQSQSQLQHAFGIWTASLDPGGQTHIKMDKEEEERSGAGVERERVMGGREKGREQEAVLTGTSEPLADTLDADCPPT